MDKILEPVESKVSVEVTATIDPKEFFKNREGLYVWSDFNERVIEKASPVKEGTKFELSSFKLLESSSDETIESELPKEHIFSESDVCAIIAELISKQPKGEEGALLNTGYFNIFYTPTFVVSVVWYSGVSGWFGRAWQRGGIDWVSYCRVFSPAADL